MDPLRFVVVGLGGYGLAHIEAVRWLATQGLGQLSGVVALNVDRQQRPDLVERLLKEHVVLYENTQQFLSAASFTADILTVPIGINMHAPVSVAAMHAGLHVYCEKPVAATVQEVDRLIEAAKETGKSIAIGFQYIYSNSIQQLKTRICDGRLGRVKTLTLMCGWPRSIQYYRRNEWAGRLRLRGDWILDSPANNAFAHFVMNALYLCSSQQGHSATPLEMRAELYRANRIESADMVQMHVVTDEGASVFITLTHVNEKEDGPSMELECEHGTVSWLTNDGATVIHYTGGGIEEFDNRTHGNWRFEGFRDLVHSIQQGKKPLCTPELARPHTVTISAMHECCPHIITIPEEFIAVVEDWEMFPPNTKGTFRRVKGLNEWMREAFRQKKFFSELGVPWGKSTPTSPVPKSFGRENLNKLLTPGY